MQTYKEYLETMKAYNFYPLSFEGWKSRKLFLWGCYKNEYNQLINENGEVVESAPKDGYGYSIFSR